MGTPPEPKELDMRNALILNAVVLFVILEADLGPHRKVGWFRVLHPLVTAGILVPIFAEAVTTSGTGLMLEVGLTAAGILVGFLAMALSSVYRSPKTQRAVSRAGVGYALLWVVVIGARAAFSYGSSHWFRSPLENWMTRHSVPGSAFTDALLFMAVGMLVTRTLGLVIRAARLEPASPGATAVAR